MGIGSTELLIILLIVLVLFGADRVPKLMSGLGKGVRDFKKGMSPEEENKDQKDRKDQPS